MNMPIDFVEVKSVDQPIKDVVMGFLKQILREGEGHSDPAHANIPALIGTACVWYYHILYDFPPLPVLRPNPTVFNPYSSISLSATDSFDSVTSKAFAVTPSHSHSHSHPHSQPYIPRRLAAAAPFPITLPAYAPEAEAEPELEIATVSMQSQSDSESMDIDMEMEMEMEPNAMNNMNNMSAFVRVLNMSNYILSASDDSEYEEEGEDDDASMTDLTGFVLLDESLYNDATATA